MRRSGGGRGVWTGPSRAASATTDRRRAARRIPGQRPDRSGLRRSDRRCERGYLVSPGEAAAGPPGPPVPSSALPIQGWQRPTRGGCANSVTCQPSRGRQRQKKGGCRKGARQRLITWTSEKLPRGPAAGVCQSCDIPDSLGFELESQFVTIKSPDSPASGVHKNWRSGDLARDKPRLTQGRRLLNCSLAKYGFFCCGCALSIDLAIEVCGGAGITRCGMLSTIASWITWTPTSGIVLS